MIKKEEKLIESINKLHINYIKQTENIIKCDDISINFWQMELKSLLDNESFYMFKKQHQKWEEKVKDTKMHLKHLYESCESTINDLEDFKNNYLKS